MLVDVVPLRREGVRLPMEVVRASVPIRAELTITTHRRHALSPPDVPERQTEASLRLVEGGTIKRGPYLSDVRLTALRGDAFVVAGVERVGHPTIGRLYPQAWWCRLVQPEANQRPGGGRTARR